VSVVQAAGNTNNGSATRTYSLADNNFYFLAAGEILTLTYTATLDDRPRGRIRQPVPRPPSGPHHPPGGSAPSKAFPEPPGPNNATLDTVSGTISFTDVNLTDRPLASAAFTSFTYTDAALHPLTLTPAQQAAVAAVEVPVSVVQAAGNSNN